jgi:electron transfer flavoprotein alpha subunit
MVVGSGIAALASEFAPVVGRVSIGDQAELTEYELDACLSALTGLYRTFAPKAILFSNDTYSQKLALRLAAGSAAARLGMGFIVANYRKVVPRLREKVAALCQ